MLLAPTGLIRDDGVALQKELLSLVSLLPNRVLELFLKRKLQRPLFLKENSINVTVAKAEADVESQKVLYVCTL